MKQSLAPKASVKRDNEWTTIDAKEIVPGDLIAIKVFLTVIILIALAWGYCSRCN